MTMMMVTMVMRMTMVMMITRMMMMECNLNAKNGMLSQGRLWHWAFLLIV